MYHPISEQKEENHTFWGHTYMSLYNFADLQIDITAVTLVDKKKSISVHWAKNKKFMQIISEKKLAALSSGCKRSMATYTREYTPLLDE